MIKPFHAFLNRLEVVRAGSGNIMLMSDKSIMDAIKTLIQKEKNYGGQNYPN